MNAANLPSARAMHYVEQALDDTGRKLAEVCARLPLWGRKTVQDALRELVRQGRARYDGRVARRRYRRAHAVG